MVFDVANPSRSSEANLLLTSHRRSVGASRSGAGPFPTPKRLDRQLLSLVGGHRDRAETIVRRMAAKRNDSLLFNVAG
jgi:hypothetical protein